MSKQLITIADNLRDLIQTHLNGSTVNVTNSVIIQSVATAIAYAIPIPASILEDTTPEDHFNSFHRHAVTRLLEALNEELIIDISQILRVAVQLWIFRYRVAFVPMSVNEILHSLANATGIYPEFVQRGVSEFQLTTGKQVATQEGFATCTRIIFDAVSNHLNQKD